MPTPTGPAATTSNTEGPSKAPRSTPLLVLTAAALWGTTGTAQVFGDVQDPVVVGAARLAVGGTALVLIGLATSGPRALLGCLRRPLVGWTALAAVATAVYQSAFFSAVASTGVATGTVVALGTAPVATGLCGAVLFGERLTRWWAGATALAVAGCAVLVTAGSSGAAAVRPAGVALAVLAGACYGLYTAAAKALLDRGVPVVAAMAVTLGLGAVLLVPVLLAGGAQLTGGRSLVMVGWLGLVTTAAAYLLFARGLRHLPAGTVGTLSLAEPLTAAALGLLILGERPGPRAALGAVSLLAGLLLAALRPGHGAPPATTIPDPRSQEARTPMTEPPTRPERCVIVVDQALPAGLAANAAAVLALSLGAGYPQLPGQDFADADGTVHPGLIPMGLPVLSAPPDRLAPLRRAAIDAGLHVIDFPTAGQQTTDYAAFSASVASTRTPDLTYLGLALCGPTRPVRKLTGGLPLLR